MNTYGMPSIPSTGSSTTSNPIYKNIVLSSGGFKGISQLGAIKVLSDRGLIDLRNLDAVAGTSAGAMLGMMLVLGMTPDEIWNLLYNLDITKFINLNILLIAESGGANDGEKIYKFIESILIEKTSIKHITFSQLYKKTGVHFTVVGSSMQTKNAVYYDHINTPSMKVSMAIRISISIPVIFTPVEIDNDCLVDGAVCDNYPIKLFRDKLNETIGIFSKETFNTNYHTSYQYLISIIMLLLHQHLNRSLEHYENHTIIIDDNDHHGILEGIIDNASKERLFKAGVDAAQAYLRDHSIL
jgi:NTE family protein